MICKSWVLSVLCHPIMASIHGRQTPLQLDTVDGMMAQFVSDPYRSYDEFKPKCLAYLKDLVQTADATYTDIQLQDVLKNHCSHAKSFELTVSSGFNDHDACGSFAKKLTMARMQHLKSGNETGYEQLCREFYLHKGGTIGQPVQAAPKTVSDDRVLSAPFIAITLLACLAFVMFTYLALQ
eukprot:GEMP01061407.1.p1 GENE.GEMP01061407.1~~GEMP01061407.1.p1  ORF type:complete len:181 (+),score=24.65 GEMP01061407.1:135-677(+)